MMEAFNEFRTILRELGSARRSPTAGSSDIVRPNPTDKVSDTAPQGPVVAPQSSNIAPGPSSASWEPRASGSGLHSDLRDDKFASPRGDLDKGDQHVGVRHASPPPSPSHQERLREELESFTLKSLTSEKSMISVATVVGHLQISLRMIWRISSPNMLSLA